MVWSIKDIFEKTKKLTLRQVIMTSLNLTRIIFLKQYICYLFVIFKQSTHQHFLSFVLQKLFRYLALTAVTLL